MLSIMNKNKLTSRNITVKFQNTLGREKNFKTSQSGGKKDFKTESRIRMALDFSVASLDARKQVRNVFKIRRKINSYLSSTPSQSKFNN